MLQATMPCPVRRESGPTLVADTPNPLYNLRPIDGPVSRALESKSADGPVSRALENKSASTNQNTVLLVHGQALNKVVKNTQLFGQNGEERTREPEPFRITPLPAAHQTNPPPREESRVHSLPEGTTA